MIVELEDDEEEELRKIRSRAEAHTDRVEEIQSRIKELTTLFQRETGKAEAMLGLMNDRIDELAEQYDIPDSGSFDMDEYVFEVKEDA